MLKTKSKTVGHILALITALIWGTTFVSSKVLLAGFSVIEVLILRFSLGYVTLWILYPRFMKVKSLKNELLFAAAGLTGVTLYFICENMGLVYTQASNLSLIVSTAPIFTAIAVAVIFREKLSGFFALGFFVAIAGIAIISFNGATELHLNPAGDLMGLLAAICWGAYSVVTRKLGESGENVLAVTRRVFFYGLVFSVPAALILGFSPNISLFAQPKIILNFAYLGIVASACCYLTWNQATNILGAVRTSVYIYLVPVTTLIFSAIILKEKITWLAILGTCLILAGLIISEKFGKKE